MLNPAFVVLAITAFVLLVWVLTRPCTNVRTNKLKANRPMLPYEHQCRSCGKTFEMLRLSCMSPETLMP